MNRLTAILLALCLKCQNSNAQLQDSVSHLPGQVLSSFSLLAGAGISENATGFNESYLAFMTRNTDVGNQQFNLGQRKTNSTLQEYFAFGVQFGWKSKIRLPAVKYGEFTAGLQFINWVMFLDFFNQDKYGPHQNYIDGQIFSMTPILGYKLHSRPFFRAFAIAAGTWGGAAVSRMGKKPDSAGNSVGYTDLGYKYGNNYLWGMTGVIKYNASCDLNVELVYQPYFVFNNFTTANQSAAFIQSFRLQLRYKLDNTPPNRYNRRTDVFF